MNINPTTGATVIDWEEYVIRFKDAVLTPLHHRIKRRPYGSKLYSLQGKSVSPIYQAKAAAYIAECYFNSNNNIQQAALISVNIGTHDTGFKIAVTVEFYGVAKSINL